MRSLFWRFFASFWLAIALVAGLSILLGRALNQDAWLLSQHPAVRDLAKQWTQRFESQGAAAAQELLEDHKRQFRIDVQVLDENGHPVIKGTFPPRAAAFEARHPKKEHLPWRRLSTEYTSAKSGETYLFIYRIPFPALASWQRESLLWPFSALGIAVLVLTCFSLWLTLSITRPLNRLRGAVHDLGQTAYQKSSLAKLAGRRDELGVLAADFNRMGERVQGLISSQRQLLRDVSHELRSPLARLRIALALTERANSAEQQKYWPRLSQECDRLEALISEILDLARVDADSGAAQPVAIAALLGKVCDDARIEAPHQQINIQVEPNLSLNGWPDLLQRALDNLLRNALRFNPAGQAIELQARRNAEQLIVSVRDHGPGVAAEHLAHLGEPFYRAPGQANSGHGLGLAIARRAAERHGGSLLLANHPQGGFSASLQLPLAQHSA
ncbi:sensor histidine kinase [Pseudomonas sp. 5P_3.1_Bac2]|uniref:sensor histidine kinase n=1 Tax=Pseudomonas sp. 5P_3.1_Bac2 TaxID=2971617 RepID=UPI0021CA9A37|nr:HAMP domain-containing sensor histidine kinase [Pseudomonas sp. 5P_3.1_Bac2]MCU1716512.1 HAMP domain-containing histidine kinase [Pseudomonas sp. 5P_3.1_Bac2]